MDTTLVETQGTPGTRTGIQRFLHGHIPQSEEKNKFLKMSIFLQLCRIISQILDRKIPSSKKRTSPVLYSGYESIPFPMNTG
jgi:hypothetical protein